MAVDEETYGRVMRDLRQRLPDVAAQIDDEARRGHPVSGSQLPREDQSERTANLRAAGATALGKGDVAVLPYTSGERLSLLCQALLTMAETMYGSRRQLLQIAHDLNVTARQVRFESDEGQGEEGDVVSLPAQVETTREALLAVQQILGPWLESEEAQS